MFYLLLYLLPVAHSLHTDGTVQWKSVTLMCRPTFRSKKPSLVKIQYVDGCKRECIIYLQRYRNYNKLLVVPTDSPYSLGAQELLTLVDTGYDCMDVWYELPTIVHMPQNWKCKSLHFRVFCLHLRLEKKN